MKIKTLILTGLLISALGTTVRAQNRIVTQATYILDSTQRDGIRMPIIDKPADWNMTVHLEVVASPNNNYDLRGWAQNDFHNNHTRLNITSGHVTSDGIPDSVTLQTTVMGEPNDTWYFYFHKRGSRMEIWDSENRMKYYFHSAP